MTKGEFIKKVATKFETTQVDAKDIINLFEEVVEECVLEDFELPVCGGKFKVKETKEKKVPVNPRKPELGTKTMPASHKIVFEPGKELKAKVKAL